MNTALQQNNAPEKADKTLAIPLDVLEDVMRFIPFAVPSGNTASVRVDELRLAYHDPHTQPEIIKRPFLNDLLKGVLKTTQNDSLVAFEAGERE